MEQDEMPVLSNSSKNKTIQDLRFVKNDEGSLSLEYILSHENIEEYTLKYGLIPGKRTNYKLMQIDPKNKFIRIYPRYCNPKSENFLKNKYSHIRSITLKGDRFVKIWRKFDNSGKDCFPKDIYDMLEIIKRLPVGFIRDYEYVLGLSQDCRFIVYQIEEEFPGIKNLVISDNEITDVKEDIFTLNYKKFVQTRRGLQRISKKCRDIGQVQKNIFAYNKIFDNLCDDLFFVEKEEPYTEGAIHDVLRRIDSLSSLSRRDSSAIFNAVSNDVENYYKDDREKVIKLQQDIELVNLKDLIIKIEHLLNKKSSEEKEWQQILGENPLILSLAFGYPIVKIEEQVSVGGRKIDGKGDKITDFLVKNPLTHNVALVEIKKPNTELLNTTKYRGGVYAASGELSGSINQLLDQKYKFQTEINTHKVNSKIYDMESYSIDCVLIIGQIPQDDEKKKCFELFRHNSKDVKVITFDELLGRLKEIQSFLSPDPEGIPF